VSHVHYSYDAAGNRTEMTADGETTTYKYNAAGEMTKVGDSRYTYDSNGNLIQKESGEGTVKYNYTPDNLLSGVFFSDGRQVSYQYDGMGRKVSRKTGNL
ncbi:MAG TPA: hypothetical protein VFK27_07445, partial [Bacillales bacterium]|nr:hypothetical protein [Bacillales bacterium]